MKIKKFGTIIISEVDGSLSVLIGDFEYDMEWGDFISNDVALKTLDHALSRIRKQLKKNKVILDDATRFRRVASLVVVQND